MPTTGNILRNARLQAHLSQGELGKRLGCSTSLISHWEADRKPISNLLAVAEALGVPIENITGNNPRPPRPSGPTRAENLIREELPNAVQPEHFLNMTDLLRWIRATYGFQVDPGRVYEWISGAEFKPPFPAYRNPLRKNPQGEPTLLFRSSEVVTWFNQMIQPLQPKDNK
jgi:transcriptional regulator with XRE-family HTH domain